MGKNVLILFKLGDKFWTRLEFVQGAQCKMADQYLSFLIHNFWLFIKTENNVSNENKSVIFWAGIMNDSHTDILISENAILMKNYKYGGNTNQQRFVHLLMFLRKIFYCTVCQWHLTLCK